MEQTLLSFKQKMDTFTNLYYVPWASRPEWETTRENIYSKDIQKMKKGYETLLIWMSKSERTPAYVITTSNLLQVLLQDLELQEKQTNDLFDMSELNLSFMYVTALLRFVNHTVSIHNKKNDTFYAVARELEIPDWIVNLRHDAAHGQNLPPLEVLRTALHFSMDWLKEKCWLYEDTPSGVSPNKISRCDNSSTDYVTKILNCWRFIVRIRSKNKGLDILDETFQEVFLEVLSLNDAVIVKLPNFNHLSQMFYKKEVDISSIENVLEKLLVDLIVSHNCCINDVIDAVFHPDIFLDNSFNINTMESLIHIIQKQKGMTKFVEKMFTKLKEELFRLKVSEWLLELGSSLVYLSDTWKIYEKLKTKEFNSSMTRTSLKQQAIIKNRRNYDTTIALKLYAPPVVTWSMLQYLLLYPTKYANDIFSIYAELLTPRIPNETVTRIKDCVSAYTLNNINTIDNVDDEMIYTVNDVYKTVNGSDMESSKCNSDGPAVWQASEIDSEEWSRTPLGLLPWQDSVNLELPPDGYWKITT